MTTVPAALEGREAMFADWIQSYEAEFAPLLREDNLATWTSNVTGSAEDSQRAAELGTRLRQLHARPEAYRFLTELRDSGGVRDPLLARQLALLIHDHRSQQIPADVIAKTVQMETALEHRFNTFRATLDGAAVGDNAIRDVLRTSTDLGLRKRAWEASKQIGGQVADDLLALVRQRNESARTIGYPDFYTMMLELKEIDGTELFALLGRLDQGTAPLFRAYRADLDARLAQRFGIAAADVRPWHMSDPFFQEAPAADVSLDAYFQGRKLETLAERFFTAIGLDIRDALAHSDLYEKPGKCQHAFCMTMDRARDVRMLCNLRPDEKWMGTLLHELGHAAYELYVDPKLPYSLRTYSHLSSTEASAMLFGRLSRNAAWLETYAGVPADEATRIAAAAREAVRAHLLVVTRWFLVMCHMERALYANPEQDLNTLWWDLVERFQLLTRPEGRHAPDWASKIHLSIAPVYYHNYLLGEMTASQLERHLLGTVLGGGPDAARRFVSAPEVGRFMASFYSSGRAYDWRETLRRATGETLEARYYIDALTPSS
jgi:peptidyl-dipeptidase A